LDDLSLAYRTPETEVTMIDDLRITVLAENTVRQVNLLAEHGLALWMEVGARRILFDTDVVNSILAGKLR